MDRIKRLLELIKSFREFGGSIPPAECDLERNWSEAHLLLQASKARRTDLPYLSGSLLLYLAGRFEYFVRQLVQSTAEGMVDSAGHSGLPEQIRKELRTRSLEVIQNPRRYGFDESQADTLLIDLAQAIGGSGNSTSVHAEVLTITDANMKDRVLADLFKRVGVEGVWKEVGKQAKMKLELGTTPDGVTTTEAQTRLNALMDDRNQIAHPTSATTFPDPDQVLSMARFIGVLAEVLTENAKVHLAGFTADGLAT
ncbi:MAG: HEPN domain-containing protein [Gemmatimonadales bacterium]|nr:HEPN domain-containing protein [Gemmatimonadales bacterium]